MTKLAILCDLDSLEQLMKQYIAEELNDDDLLEQMRFSHFLLWLRSKRQEMMTHGTKSDYKLGKSI